MRFNPLLLWTVLLAVLVVRAGDTHLHLCFDGLEPAASVHIADASIHHDDGEHHPSESHDDKDIDPFVGAFTKSDDDSKPAFAFIVGMLLAIEPVDPVERFQPLDRFFLPDTGPPFYLRPPLRGPPV